jgi:hypothetical protein
MICATLGARILNDDRETDQFIPLRCKMWSCEDCGPINARLLEREIADLIQGFEDRCGITEAKLRYAVKLVTLTLPGYLYRENHTPEEMEQDIKRYLGKLMDQLRKKRGVIEYLWVRELQKDHDAPHIHLLIFGPGVVDADIKDFIEHLWRDVYGMGFCWISVVKTSKGMARYLVKYLAKGLGEGMKGYRVYSMSRGARQILTAGRIERKLPYTLFQLYSINSEGKPGTLIFERYSVDPGMPDIFGLPPPIAN